MIWGTACPTNLKPLVLLQKKCIRIICGADYLDHTDPLFEITKVLKLEQIHILSCAKFIYNCYKLDIYTYFRARLVLNSQIHHYNTRISSNLRAPFERLESAINLPILYRVLFPTFHRAHSLISARKILLNAFDQ